MAEGTKHARRGRPHDEHIVALAKGLLANGWPPKRVAWMLGVAPRAVANWAYAKGRYPKPDFRLHVAILHTLRRELNAYGCPTYGPQVELPTEVDDEVPDSPV